MGCARRGGIDKWERIQEPDRAVAQRSPQKAAPTPFAHGANGHGTRWLNDSTLDCLKHMKGNEVRWSVGGDPHAHMYMYMYMYSCTIY